MKKIFAGLIALSFLASCVEREDIPENVNEKTNLKTDNSEILKKTSDTLGPLLLPANGPTPPGFEIDPGEVGPIVTTPPK